jgi:hypothetical protein
MISPLSKKCFCDYKSRYSVVMVWWHTIQLEILYSFKVNTSSSFPLCITHCAFLNGFTILDYLYLELDMMIS